MVPLTSHPEKESLAMWRGLDEKSVYNLQDFRLFPRDSSGNLRVPLESDFQGYFAYYKGLQNESYEYQEKELQIGQYCMRIGGNDNETLLYISKYNLRFDNTSIKYGCSRDSFKMIVHEFGINTEPECIPFYCFYSPYTEVLRYEHVLIHNQRPLPPYDNIICHFKNALKTDFSDMLELRLNNFRNFKKYLPNHEESIPYMEFLGKAISVAQTLLTEEKQKSLLEITLKFFIIGTGGNFGVQTLESECKELVRILNVCLKNSAPISMEGENCKKNSTKRNENEKYFKNDLVVEVIRGALDLTSSQCFVTLDGDDHERFLRLYPKVIKNIYRSPLLHEKFWFLETVHVKVLLPGLSNAFLTHLKKLNDHVRKKFKPGDAFFTFSALKWRRTERLYQFKKSLRLGNGNTP